LVVFSTALAFAIYFRLVNTLGSVGTTAQAYLRVPIGVGIGALFLGESLTANAWIGLCCVVAGVAAMTMPSRRPALAA
jgi:drug/metabolite transporter (DMT)-like permease